MKRRVRERVVGSRADGDADMSTGRRVWRVGVLTNKDEISHAAVAGWADQRRAFPAAEKEPRGSERSESSLIGQRDRA